MTKNTPETKAAKSKRPAPRVLDEAALENVSGGGKLHIAVNPSNGPT